jgi:hypothetical protein
MMMSKILYGNVPSVKSIHTTAPKKGVFSADRPEIVTIDSVHTDSKRKKSCIRVENHMTYTNGKKVIETTSATTDPNNSIFTSNEFDSNGKKVKSYRNTGSYGLGCPSMAE